MRTDALTGGNRRCEDLIAEWHEIADGDGSVDQNRGLAWLAGALRIAAQIEFSTIPPYLCALWSIKDQASSAALTIRHVVQEEMLHMSLACNMLVSLGDDYSVGMADPDFVPTYPGELAGGVHKGLQIRLAGLTHDTLRVFLEIELPSMNFDNAVEALRRAEMCEPEPAGDITIGDFYQAILTAFETLDPTFHLDRQITGPLSWIPIASLADVERAIHLIVDQGEGSAKGPTEYDYRPGEPIELSHFYRFLELAAEQRIIPMDESGEKWGFGHALKLPDCFAMAPVPVGGYSSTASCAPPRVIDLCTDFNKHYTRMLRHLDKAWDEGDQGSLVHAVEAMFSLADPARELMSIPLETGCDAKGTYGPDFRLVETTGN